MDELYYCYECEEITTDVSEHIENYCSNPEGEHEYTLACNTCHHPVEEF